MHREFRAVMSRVHIACWPLDSVLSRRKKTISSVTISNHRKSPGSLVGIFQSPSTQSPRHRRIWRQNSADWLCTSTGSRSLVWRNPKTGLLPNHPCIHEVSIINYPASRGRLMIQETSVFFRLTEDARVPFVTGWTNSLPWRLLDSCATQHNFPHSRTKTVRNRSSDQCTG